jgi:hypothetical protein
MYCPEMVWQSVCREIRLDAGESDQIKLSEHRHMLLDSLVGAGLCSLGRCLVKCGFSAALGTKAHGIGKSDSSRSTGALHIKMTAQINIKLGCVQIPVVGMHQNVSACFKPVHTSVWPCQGTGRAIQMCPRSRKMMRKLDFDDQTHVLM